MVERFHMQTCVGYNEYLKDVSLEFNALREVYEKQGAECDDFYKKLDELEVLLKFVYKKAINCTRREDDLDLIRDVWSGMMDFCKTLHEFLQRLKKESPACCSETHSNLIMDYYNAVKERWQQVCEEIECRKKFAEH